MEARQNRHLTERDLRALSTDDLLNLIRNDIKELDQIILAQRRKDREKKPDRRKAAEETVSSKPTAVDPTPPEVVELHEVICCNHHMGDFPPFARVRCPFCGQWHRAGDFPAKLSWIG